MPVLSLHNTYTLPSGSASYTLGLSGAPVASSYSFPTATGGFNSSVLGGASASQVGQPVVSSLIGTGLNLSSTNHPLSSTLTNFGYNTNSSYSTYTNPLLSSGVMNMSMKMKPLDDIELSIGKYGNRAGTPCSPIPPTNWGLDSYSGIDGVNPAFMHSQQRPLSRIGLDLEGN